MHSKLSPSTISVDLKGVPGHLSQIFTSTTTQKCHYVEPTFIQQSLLCAKIECNTIDIIKFYKVLLTNSWLMLDCPKVFCFISVRTAEKTSFEDANTGSMFISILAVFFKCLASPYFSKFAELLALFHHLFFLIDA